VLCGAGKTRVMIAPQRCRPRVRVARASFTCQPLSDRLIGCPQELLGGANRQPGVQHRAAWPRIDRADRWRAMRAPYRADAAGFEARSRHASLPTRTDVRRFPSSGIVIEVRRGQPFGPGCNAPRCVQSMRLRTASAAGGSVSPSANWRIVAGARHGASAGCPRAGKGRQRPHHHR
jgi:hypothetical protein